MQDETTRFPATGRLEEGDLGIIAIKSTQYVHAVGLRLDSYDPCSKPTERTNAIADMRADVECKVARANEPCIESIHRRVAGRVSIVDLERAPQGGDPRGALEDG